VIADGRALLLRLTDGMIVDDDLLDGRGSASASAISPDGSTAAIGLSTGAVVMIDLMTTRVSEQEYRPFSGNVEQIFFSPDGQRLAVGSEAEVALIDLRVGRTIGRSIAAELGLTQPFGQSGKIVVSIDDEPRAGVAVIDLTPTRWASIACEIAGRDLSHQEWETYLPDDAPYRSTCAALG
jgi:hypothetical protein